MGTAVLAAPASGHFALQSHTMPRPLVPSSAPPRPALSADTTSSEAEVATRLAHRIAAGEVAAEEELVERYSRGVLFLLRRRSGRPDLADDLHQETFRVVIERLRGRGLEDPSRLAAFTHRIAENLFLAHYRKTARRRTDGEQAISDVADAAPSQLEHTLRDEAATLVRQVLADLRPPRDRQILYRFYLAEEAKERICADFGLSSLHFNRVLHRARQRLRDLLERAAKRRRLETRHS